MLRLLAVMLLAATPFAAACGEATIKPKGAAHSVVDVVARQTGFRPTDVRCPDGVEAKVGKTFDCHFTGPEGRDYTARMRITDVKGERVRFFITSRPSG